MNGPHSWAKRAVMSLAVVAGAVTLAHMAHAVPIQWMAGVGANKHFYETVRLASSSWAVARADALTRSHLGQPGYLVTLTSADEQLFVFLNAVYTPPAGPDVSARGWIGASDEGTEGAWLWMDGPETGQQFWSGGILGTDTGPHFFANWEATAPNNGGPGHNEDYAALNGVNGRWHDLAATVTQDYYIVEYNGPPPPRPPDPVPEPGALGLWGIGLVGLIIAVRHRRTSSGTSPANRLATGPEI